MSAEVSKMLKKSKYTKKGDTLKETVRAAGVTMTKQFLDKKHTQELRSIRMIKDNGGGRGGAYATNGKYTTPWLLSSNISITNLGADIPQNSSFSQVLLWIMTSKPLPKFASLQGSSYL